VKQEKLDWLADNPFYTKRFAFYVGRRCRSGTISDIARELKLDWKTVKDLDKQYMREQLRRAPKPGPRVIGVDEISIRKGHTYRIVVSDLGRGRPIWFGGEDRSEASMDQFYEWLGLRKCSGIELAVMDMWKAFGNSARRNAPQAAILFDKFHVMRHLGEALDTVRKSEYRRLQGKDRKYIKGQKYTLLSNRENLSIDGRRALKQLLAANKRLNKAYLLKESFGQLWDYRREGWARRFFDNWKTALKWQRLKLRGLRCDDRATLGWYRRVLSRGEQSLAGVRRRAQQQDPRHPATCVWSSRRGVSQAEDPHLHAPADLICTTADFATSWASVASSMTAPLPTAGLLAGPHPSAPRSERQLVANSAYLPRCSDRS
jgi:transposase